MKGKYNIKANIKTKWRINIFISKVEIEFTFLLSVKSLQLKSQVTDSRPNSR